MFATNRILLEFETVMTEPPDNRMRQTVGPVTGRAYARPAPGRPAADA